MIREIVFGVGCGLLQLVFALLGLGELCFDSGAAGADLGLVGFLLGEGFPQGDDVVGAKLTRVAFIYPDGLELPACWLTPAKPDASKPPVLMIGAKGRADWAAEAQERLSEGASVLVADITGYGEIGKPNAIFYGADDCPEEGVSVMLYLMGESMTGCRATDMLVLADWIKGRTGIAPELVARGSAAIPAAHARAAAPGAFSKVSVSDAPMSWTEFIEKGDTVRYRYTYMVVNGLLHYDWPDLLK